MSENNYFCLVCWGFGFYSVSSSHQFTSPSNLSPPSPPPPPPSPQLYDTRYESKRHEKCKDTSTGRAWQVGRFQSRTIIYIYIYPFIYISIYLLVCLLIIHSFFPSLFISIRVRKRQYRRPLFYSWRCVAVVVASKNGILRLIFRFRESYLHKCVASSLQVLYTSCKLLAIS